ncbi:MAG: hypothetical protein HC824_13970 [Synechococcales cyanobacterium RM1_1_8]|nr:hypothetical protein [Synechococcales cyanobacterium RM1_1_8]
MQPHPSEQSQVQQLATLLAGEFCNQTQALENPAWFVALRLWQRQVPLAGTDLFGPEGAGSVALFLEQASLLRLDQPYRQRLLRLYESEGAIYGQYYQFKEFAAWRGAGAEPGRLQQLQASDLVSLAGCRVAIACSSSPATSPPSSPLQVHYRATLVAGGRCEFEYDGKLRRVIVGFELEQTGAISTLKTDDKGIDPDTGQGLWGALMGPYEFVKLS